MTSFTAINHSYIHFNVAEALEAVKNAIFQKISYIFRYLFACFNLWCSPKTLENRTFEALKERDALELDAMASVSRTWSRTFDFHNDAGLTPLEVAYNQGDEDNVIFFLQQGAQGGEALLCRAYEEEKFDLIQRLVTEGGVNPNITIKGTSLLFRAYQDAQMEDLLDEEDSPRFKLVNNLIAAGAKPPREMQHHHFGLRARFNLYRPLS